MDDLRLYDLLNNISVISERRADDNERLCAMEPCLWFRSFRLERGSNSEPLDQYSSATGAPIYRGTPIAQWVKRWPTDLAVPGSVLPKAEIFYNRKRSSIAHSLSLSSVHRPDMTKTLLKRTDKTSLRVLMHRH